MTKRRRQYGKPTTIIPTTFNIQALAKALITNARDISQAPTEERRLSLTQRHAGLTEAWTLMTRSEREIIELVEGRSLPPAEHVTRVLDEALVIAADMKAYTATI